MLTKNILFLSIPTEIVRRCTAIFSNLYNINLSQNLTMDAEYIISPYLYYIIYIYVYVDYFQKSIPGGNNPVGWCTIPICTKYPRCTTVLQRGSDSFVPITFYHFPSPELILGFDFLILLGLLRADAYLSYDEVSNSPYDACHLCKLNGKCTDEIMIMLSSLT